MKKMVSIIAISLAFSFSNTLAQEVKQVSMATIKGSESSQERLKEGNEALKNKEYKKAQEIFEALSDEGVSLENIEAKNHLGIMYEFGHIGDKKDNIIERNQKAGVYLLSAYNNLKIFIEQVGEEHFDTIIEEQSAPIQRIAASFYIGEKEDTEKGIRYFELALNQGDVITQVVLGEMYRYGKKGVTKDIQKAISYYELAANSGNLYAQETLGNLFSFGAEVEKNKEKAIYYNTLAAKQGSEKALQEVSDYFVDGQDFENYAKFLEEIAQNEDLSDNFKSFPYLRLGLMYCAGKGVQKDVQKGIGYLESISEEIRNSPITPFGFGFSLGTLNDFIPEIKNNPAICEQLF